MEVAVSDGHMYRKVAQMEAKNQPRNDAERLGELLRSLSGDDLMALVRAFADAQRDHEHNKLAF